MHADSLLYIELPHEDLMREELETVEQKKRHWHEHINFFSTSALERLLKRCDLKIIDIQSIEVESAGKQVNILQAISSIK